MADIAVERFEVVRTIAATPAAVFAVLRDPQGHVTIDSSGMLQSAEGGPVGAVDDTFVVHMDREALGDRPLGQYDVTVVITAYEPDALIEWRIVGIVKPPLGHRFGYRLSPAEGGTRVVSYYDWSWVDVDRRTDIFPVIPEASLRATLGILARTVGSERDPHPPTS